MRARALSACIVCASAAVGCNDSLSSQVLTASTGAFAVLSDKYLGNTTISLLDDMGQLSKDKWINAETMSANLQTPIGHDVVLPSVSSEPRNLTTIQRSLGIVTRFDTGSGTVLGQLHTDDSEADDIGAYHSVPYDALYIDDDSSWIARSRQNPDENAADRDRGNDLIEWNPETFKRTARRIDLSDLNEDIDEMQLDNAGNATGTTKSTAYASPASLVPVGDFVAVGLMVQTQAGNYGPGKLAIVDLEKARRVSDLRFDGLTNCAEVKRAAGDLESVIVSCRGAYSEGAPNSGILKISVDDAGTAKIERTYLNADHDDQPTLTGNVASVGGDIVVAVAAGHIDPMTSRPDATDRLMRVDLASGGLTELYNSDGAFSIGVPGYAEKSGILIVPDAGDTSDKDKVRSGVNRFIVTVDRTVKMVDWVPVAKDSGLPARQVLSR